MLLRLLVTQFFFLQDPERSAEAQKIYDEYIAGLEMVGQQEYVKRDHSGVNFTPREMELYLQEASKVTMRAGGKGLKVERGSGLLGSAFGAQTGAVVCRVVFFPSPRRRVTDLCPHAGWVRCNKGAEYSRCPAPQSYLGKVHDAAS